MLGGALLLTSNRADRAADQSIDIALNATRAAIEDALTGRSRMLLEGAARFVQAPNYVARINAAIDSRRRADLLDLADEFLDQTGAVWALITDRDGVQQAWTRERGAFGDDLSEGSLVGMALAWDSTEGVWIEPGPDGDVIYQAVGVPVFSPARTAIYGVLVAARPIDSTFAFELKGRTNSDIVFFARDTLGVPFHVVASTLPRGSIDSVISHMDPARVFNATNQRPHERMPIAGDTLVGVVGPLATASGYAVGGYVGIRSRDVEPAAFAELRRTMVFAFGMGLVLALVLSLLVTRQITRPVKRLVEATQRVAAGHYSGTIDVTSRDEIGQLASAFNRMLIELRDKEELVKYLRSAMISAEHSDEATAQAEASRAGTVGTSHATRALSVGMTLANRYKILDVLGAGGMGIVYHAYDRELEEPVAIKVLKSEAVQADSTTLERFKQEIRLARHITHQNVVRTHDLGEVDGTYYITMEYVDGATLADLILKRGRLPVGVVLTIGKQLCRALEIAHEQGVIHRDIKPANLIVDARGFLKVMDFGIACLAERQREVERITDPGAVVGTPEYMAPELLLGEEVDAQADLYSAGAVLFECLIGRSVFSGPTVAALVAKHVKTEPEDPRTLNPDVPDGLARLILRALAKKREERWSSATQMYEALDALWVAEAVPS